MTDRFNPANKLKGFRSTPVVHEAIRDYDRKKFKEYRQKVGKELLIGGGTLLLGLASITPVGRAVTGIRKAIKMAGSIGNVKKPDTVGNRIKQAQAIMGKSPKDKPFGNRASMLTQDGKPASTKNPMLGTVVGTSASTKYYRTLTSAIEQGPVKFFSRGMNPKTGITPFKRSRGGLSNKELKKESDIVRMEIGASRDLPVFTNNTLIMKTLRQNEKARKDLRKK